LERLQEKDETHASAVELVCNTRCSEYFCSLSERDRMTKQGSVVFPKLYVFTSPITSLAVPRNRYHQHARWLKVVVRKEHEIESIEEKNGT
jgi:hypothetical protein